MEDIWALKTAEREDFASFLDSLEPHEWDAPSLCDGWKVRHVAAHVLGESTFSLPGFMATMVRSGFDPNKTVLRMALADGDRMTPAELVKALREHAADRRRPPGVSPAGVLVDNLVHHQDCRRALGKPRAVPEDRVRAALDDLAPRGTILKAKQRIAGLKLVATDMDWSRGDGPEVQGSGEALLMAMAGRPAALDDLSGPGVATLRSRA
jgi:uncharacterized protein (TIGR03083 family)